MYASGLLVVGVAALAAQAALAPAPRAAAQGVDAVAPPRYVPRVWTTDEGLPQNSVTTILQTRDGHLWLGTFGGLVRFDGLRFTILTSANTPALRSNRITQLLETRDGALWVGAEPGSVTRFAGGEAVTIGPDEGLPAAGVSQMLEARDASVWIGTDRGLAHLNGKSLRVYLPSLRILRVVERDDGAMWVGTPDGVWSIRDGRVRRELATTRWAYTLACAPDGSLWVGSGSLYRIDERGASVVALPGLRDFSAILVDRSGAVWAGGTGGLARVSATGIETFRHFARAPLVVNILAEAPDGAIWIGLIGGQIVRYHQGRFEPLGGDRVSSAPDLIRTIAFDRERNVWIGRDVGGLTRWRPGEVGALTMADGLPARSAFPVLQARDGSVWIGTFCGGLAHAGAGRLDTYGTRQGLPDECVGALLEDRAGTLWVGTLGGLVRRTATGFVPTGVPHGVYALHQDRRGDVWAGTVRGLARVGGDEVTWFTTAHGLVHDEVRFVTDDREGSLWIGTSDGLSRFHDGRFTNYTRANGLPHGYVRAIHEDADGALWIGTYGGGLARFLNGRFVVFTTRDGLHEDVVSRIIEDEQETFWMTGNRGVSRVARQDLNEYAGRGRPLLAPVLYTAADGMPASETNGGTQPSGWRARDGRLWIPTIDGVAVIDPRVRETDWEPPVTIEEVLVDGEPAASVASVEVPAGARNLEIRYTGISLAAPEAVRFRYRLDGYDSDWIDVGTRRAAYYTRVPPGAYTFRVAAANARGRWGQADAHVAINAAPALWQTWWMRALMLLAAAGALAAAYRARVNLMKRRHAAQVAFSRRLIESQEAERKRIASELHDSLGQSLAIIRNRAMLALGASDHGAHDHLERISEDAGRAVEEVRQIARNLRPYQIDHLGLAGSFVAMARGVEETSDLHVDVSVDQTPLPLAPDVQVGLYRIVQEAVGNIIKHSGATEAGIAMHAADDGWLRITVRDNGRGFATDEAARRPRGLGLTSIAERATMLGARCEIQSAQGQGTTVSLAIKCPGGSRADV